MLENYRLIVLANKYPTRVDFTKKAGGLEDALLGYMLSEEPDEPKGLWVGAVTDKKDVRLRTCKLMDGFLHQKGVYLDDGLHESHYIKACNEGDWTESHLDDRWDIPLLNDFLKKEEINLPHLQRFIQRCLISPNSSTPFYYPDPLYDFDAHRDNYVVSNKFAESTFDEMSGNEIIWVHDYHLRLVAKALYRLTKSEGADVPIGFFLHIPAPPYKAIEPQIEKDPTAIQIFDDKLEAFLYYNAVGLQTVKYVDNLMDSYRARSNSDNLNNKILAIEELAEGIYRIAHNLTDKGSTYFFAQPIGINPSQIIKAARRKGPIQFELIGGHTLEDILKDCEKHNIPVLEAFDRADITKGFYERFLIFDYILRYGVPFVAISFAPETRREIEAYDNHWTLLHGMARAINNYHRIKRTDGLSRIFDLGLSPIYIEPNKIPPPWIHKLRRRGNEGAFSIKDGQHIGALQHIIANSLNLGKNFTMVSEGCGVYQQLKKYAQTEEHGIVGLNMFDIEGSGKKIIEAMNDPKNRHSKEVVESVINQDIQRFVEYNIGFILAAHENKVLEFIESQNN